MSDEELVARCKTELPNDTRSFEILVNRYMNRVYSLVFRVVTNKEEAEDLSQEIFVKVYNNLKKFEQQAAFSTWLYRIATNTALDALHKTRRRPQKVASPSDNPDREEKFDLLDHQLAPGAGPEERVMQAELRECIGRVLHKLDQEQARLLLMRDFNDLSYDEIAALLGTGLSATKMRIHRSRLAFQHLFNQFCGKMYLPAASAEKAKAKVNLTQGS